MTRRDIWLRSSCTPPVAARPAGATLAYLLARRGIDVTLLERQVDFAREFRGEGLMPLTPTLSRWAAPQPGCSTGNCRIDTGDTRVSGEVIYASGSLYVAFDTSGTKAGARESHFLWFQIFPVLTDNDSACNCSYFQFRVTHSYPGFQNGNPG